MNRIRFILTYAWPVCVWALAFPLLARSASFDGKTWALYSWIDGDDWKYSLMLEINDHPDASEVREHETKKLEAIKTRISLLKEGTGIELNPLPVLNLELHPLPDVTVKELERVCGSAKLNLSLK